MGVRHGGGGAELPAGAALRRRQRGHDCEAERGEEETNGAVLGTAGCGESADRVGGDVGGEREEGDGDDSQRPRLPGLPAGGVDIARLVDAAQLSSLSDETPEGRSVVVLAKERHGLRERAEGQLPQARFVPFTAQSRMSGVDLEEDGAVRLLRKGAATAVMHWIRESKP